jgi:hypothetical protein
MRESRKSGSVRGAASDRRPYSTPYSGMMAPPCSDQLPPGVPINPRPPFRDDAAQG